MVDCGRIGEPSQRPVVEAQIDSVEATELRPREKQDDERGACAEQEAGGDQFLL